MLAADPLDYGSPFQCGACDKTLSSATVFVLCKELEEKLEQLHIMELKPLEELLTKYLLVNANKLIHLKNPPPYVYCHSFSLMNAINEIVTQKIRVHKLG